MSSIEPIRPLKDVWLRPRRVFRELAGTPVGITDYLLAAAQGVATWIAMYRSQLAVSHVSVAEILQSSLLFGPIGGIVSLYLFAAVYARLGARAGGASARNAVFHVLAYGGIPVIASLLLWTVSLLLVGESAIAETPGAELDGFVAALLWLQFAGYLFLFLWSVVLQIMGFSEILGLATRKAFGVWLLGQVLVVLAALFLSLLIAILFPGAVPNSPH
jgi:hypothetical protein